MNTESRVRPGTVLNEWRTTILNVFLSIAAAIALPAVGTIVANAVSQPETWAIAVSFSIFEILLIALAVFRRISFWVRVGGLLLIGYVAAVVNLARTGLAGAGPLYLLAIPVIGLILAGRRAGLITFVLSLLLSAVAAVMLDRGLLVPQLWTRTTWMALTTIVMFLTIVMTLLILFYRFQERLINDERRAQAELVRAHSLLEEQNIGLERKVQERTEELTRSSKVQTALYQITDAAASSRDMQQFYAQVHRIVGELMFAKNLSIALYDEKTGLVSSAYLVDEREEPFPTQPLAEVRGMAGYIIRTGNPIRHGTVYAEDGELGQGAGRDRAHVEHGIGAPLLANGRVLGAITLRSYSEKTRFTEQDADVLGFVAQHIATALARLRALEAERQRTSELAILSSVGQAMTESLDIKRVTRIVGDKVREIFGSESAMIMLLDKETNLIHSHYEYDENEGGYIDYVEPFPLGKGLASKVITSRQPLILNTLEEEVANGAYFPPEIIEKGSGFFSQSWLGVPILVKDDVLGLVALADGRAHAFSDNHLRLLQTLSSNVGVAIENARLFQAEQHRAAELAAVNTVSAALASELDLRALIPLVGEQIRSTFNADIAYVALLDETTGTILFPYTYGEELTPIRFGEGLTSKVIEGNKPLLINKELERETLDMGTTIVGKPSLSYLGVPINVTGKAVGVLSVQSTAREGVFDEADVRLLSTIAADVGTALHNAQLFEETRRAQADAERANAAKSVFLANMSHELRTPLNAIIGFTRIVRRKADGVLPEKQTENLDKVLISAENLLTLINTILDIAKIEAGRMDVMAANFRIHPLIDLCANTAQPLLKHAVVLEKRIDESLTTAYSDQDKIRQIVLNLLSNAAKFTHEGKIVLAAGKDGEGNLRISVSDTGIGISKEALPRIFKEFQQADTSTTRQYGGTGLGLSISRNLAHLLGGDLTVESELGKGSTFTLTIPIQYRGSSLLPSESPPARPAGREPTRGETAAQHIEAASDKKRVLVIDHDPDAVYLLRESLDQRLFEVTGTRNGLEGMKLARQQQPHAILLDVLMPETDGWQVLHDLKEDSATSHIPVILLTIVDRKALGFRLGAAAYLLKPLDPVAVREALDRVIGATVGRQKHVLVVDDDPNIADMLRQFLPESDFLLDSALDGAAGLQLVAARRPDVILLDLVMPKLDGFGVIENLRGDPATRDIPVIVISAKDLTADESAHLKESVALVMRKQGFQGELLAEEINKVLAGQKDRRELA